jgi:hypothetical protein
MFLSWWSCAVLRDAGGVFLRAGEYNPGEWVSKRSILGVSALVFHVEDLDLLGSFSSPG